MNSGARVFMADFEDALSPTWQNVVEGQRNLAEAVRGTIELETERKTYRLNEETAVLVPRPRGWHLHERHAARRRRAGLGEPLRLRARLLPQRGRAARARLGAVLLPAEAREPSRGAALERRIRPRPGRARHRPGNDSRNRAHRDDPRRVRDGRDPLRAPRARLGAERRALGLHLQRDQEVPPAARLRPARSRPGDDDRPVHARVHRAARRDLPQARRARDGRHGRVHPVPEGSRGQRGRARQGARGQGARGRRRVRRDVGRASGPRARGDRGLRLRPR